MNLVIITPILNEQQNIVILAEQLASSSKKPDLWIVVDDGSEDGGATAVEALELPFNTIVLRRDNAGGLIGGSAFTAWQHGVEYAEKKGINFEHIMKLDADVQLPVTYLQSVLESFRSASVGLAGGVLVGKGNREQTVHVPGPVKLYSRRAYQELKSVPRVVGFDVMDELAIKCGGMKVIVRKDLQFEVRRPIGASQGLVHGRRRNGQVCRWTGYWAPYFLLHALRYVFRKPYGIGAIAMIAGYLRAGAGPYPANLKVAHREEQKEKLNAALKSPTRWVRETYGIEPTNN